MQNSDQEISPYEPTDPMEEFSEIRELLDSMPEPHRDAMVSAVERAERGFFKRHQIAEHLQEIMGQVRFDMQYLLFDLEATRRERDKYRQQLDESHGE